MDASSQFIEKLRSFLQDVPRRENGLVLAVSGGPDSTALAHGVARLWPGLGGGRLVLAHLNHQLRGRESDDDELSIHCLYEELQAQGLSLTLRSERMAVRAQAEADDENLEHTARTVRYAWLAKVALEEHASWVATGHTANDQAETVLHHMIRGSGLRGLRGIATRRQLAPHAGLLRPLLRVTRDEVIAFLMAEGQTYRQDSSNYDMRRTRNRIRHRLLPHLIEEYNPHIVRKLCQLAARADTAYRVEARAARRLLLKSELPRAGPTLVFDVVLMRAAPRALVREALRQVWRRESWPARRMGFSHWQRLAAVARGEESALDLPGGIRARLQGHVVQLGPVREARSEK